MSLRIAAAICYRFCVVITDEKRPYIYIQGTELRWLGPFSQVLRAGPVEKVFIELFLTFTCWALQVQLFTAKHLFHSSGPEGQLMVMRQHRVIPSQHRTHHATTSNCTEKSY